jgi:CRP-like cAMP-binding protein
MAGMVPAGLERCALVRDLPPDARAVATASAERRSLLTGEVLFHRGDDGRDPYVVLSGTLEVLDDDGRAVALVRAGDVVGERTLLNGGVRNATVRAARDTDVGRFPADVLTRLFDEHPAALRGVAGMLAERMTFRASTDERHSHIVAIVGLGAPESTSAVVSSLAARDGAVVVDAARVEREVGPGAAEAVPGTPLASRVSAWLERLEATHRMLVVVCGGRRWTARCLRIADTSAAIVDGSRVPLPHRFAGLVAIGRHGGAPARGVAATWFDAVTPVRVLHVDVSS